MFKTQELESQGMRVLKADELDLVSGGIIDGCISLPTFGPTAPTSDWEFKDVFTRYVIGRHMPR